MMPIRTLLAIAALVSILWFVGGTIHGAEPSPWRRLSEHAAFPPSYNYPVHVAEDGRFVALHPEGTWVSRDGRVWRKSALPFSGMNAAYLPYVQHDGATWALGRHTGNYLGFTIDPVIRHTRDYRRWIDVGRSPTLPKRVFHAAASFRGSMWLLGGHDGTRETSDVWRSSNGIDWVRMVERAPWTPRASAKAIVFRGRLYLIGGGRVDGPIANDVWSSADGIAWRRDTVRIAAEEPIGYTPVVYRDRIWLIGANRSGRFRSEMLVSGDGKTWRPQSAPWSPRGGVAAWTGGGALYLTGGKYSTVVRGETVFAYRNDVWRMHLPQVR